MVGTEGRRSGRDIEFDLGAMNELLDAERAFKQCTDYFFFG
jgi:hypothetical protein